MLYIYVFLSCVGLNHYVAITKFIILLYNRLRISISFITSLNKNERNKIAAVYGKSRLEMECALVVVIVSKLNTEVTVPEKLICYIRCYTRCQPWSSDRFSREKQVVYIQANEPQVLDDFLKNLLKGNGQKTSHTFFSLFSFLFF